MAEEQKPKQTEEEKKQRDKEVAKALSKQEAPKPEAKPKEDKTKETKSEVPKKDEAVAYGRNLPVSKKQCMYIGSFIKNKTIDQALGELQLVIDMKKAVPFKGEIPHRKGKGMMSGRYPVKAAKLFIALLKGLKGNVIVNGMDPDKTKITISSASWARRPARKGGRHAKRTNVILNAREADSKGESDSKKKQDKKKEPIKEKVTKEEKK